MDTTVQALKNLYVAKGGEPANVENINVIPDMINELAGLSAIADVTIEPEAQSASFWGTDVSAMQGTDIEIGENTITGSLKYVASGSLVDVWGVHNFIALKFIDPNDADDIKVGLKNLKSLDEDMNAVLAIESNTQKLRVQVTKNGAVKTTVYDLSGLTLATE